MACRLEAQNLTAVYNFGSIPGDGADPVAGLILSGDTLYGTSSKGGIYDKGTVFAVNTNGTGFTNLYSFTATSGSYPYTNSDGATPEAGLILSGSTLYGTAFAGGTHGNGTVFAVNTNGTGFTNLYSFSATVADANSDGANPLGGLLLSGNTLYGTAQGGGIDSYGTVFALNTNGTGFTNLHTFNDGVFPSAGLILSGNTLYGTSSSGGTYGSGTVFALQTNGTGFTILHSFASYPTEGGTPLAGLILSGNTLYGTTTGGGANGTGTVFAVSINSTAFTNLHSFSAPVSYINSDGVNPKAGVILSANTLYGTASAGGTDSYGTVFAVNIDGSGFTTLHNFTGGNDGAVPYAGLILSGSTFYGTAAYGGPYNQGTVFALSLVPSLAIALSGNQVILAWPTNFPAVTLQSTTNLGPSAVWSPVSATPGIPNGQYTVTNPISGAQQYFRLAGP